ncbi:MAG TPA: response regulator [Vicinamibacterales bacterium]|nr:response regulator [Vicinamibacterales bacterium]
MTVDATGRTGSSPFFSRPSADAAVVESGGVKSPRILVVEDQEDVRRMMATALEIEGYRVDEAANAQDGLRQLRTQRYDLVLSDYAMPGGTGTWMLAEAVRFGLMRETPALIVTAHPDVRELANVAVINKPLDLDYFLDEVRHLVGPSQRSARWSSDFRIDPIADEHAEAVELVLYVSSTSPASIEAQRNLELLLQSVDRTRVRWTVVDLATNPWAGAADRVAFTPTLVKRSPGPPAWVLGNLRDRTIVANLLRASGIDVAR